MYTFPLYRLRKKACDPSEIFLTDEDMHSPQAATPSSSKPSPLIEISTGSSPEKLPRPRSRRVQRDLSSQQETRSLLFRFYRRLTQRVHRTRSQGAPRETLDNVSPQGLSATDNFPSDPMAGVLFNVEHSRLPLMRQQWNTRTVFHRYYWGTFVHIERDRRQREYELERNRQFLLQHGVAFEQGDEELIMSEIMRQADIQRRAHIFERPPQERQQSFGQQSDAEAVPLNKTMDRLSLGSSLGDKDEDPVSTRRRRFKHTLGRARDLYKMLGRFEDFFDDPLQVGLSVMESSKEEIPKTPPPSVESTISSTLKFAPIEIGPLPRLPSS
jgi:hypothetical protein